MNPRSRLLPFVSCTRLGALRGTPVSRSRITYSLLAELDTRGARAELCKRVDRICAGSVGIHRIYIRIDIGSRPRRTLRVSNNGGQRAKQRVESRRFASSRARPTRISLAVYADRRGSRMHPLVRRTSPRRCSPLSASRTVIKKAEAPATTAPPRDYVHLGQRPLSSASEFIATLEY